MGICAIISGGEQARLTDIDKAQFVIACDKGAEYAHRADIVPDLLVGDFDSLNDADCVRAKKILRLPAEKNDTDTMFAVKEALKERFSEIYMYCAAGGRPDHFLGNLQAAAFAAEKGVKTTIFSDSATFYVFTNGSVELVRRSEKFFSVIALSDRCDGVCIDGAKYPLDNAVITNDFPLGISNEWVQNTVKICVKGGVAVVVCAEE